MGWCQSPRLSNHDPNPGGPNLDEKFAYLAHDFLAQDGRIRPVLQLRQDNRQIAIVNIIGPLNCTVCKRSIAFDEAVDDASEI